MRYLALDYGTKRVGVAVSDELRIIAQPLEYIPAEPFDTFLARLRQIISEHQVERVFIGMPRNMDGTYGPAARRVQEFMERLLAELPVPIQTLDERLTSAQANRVLLQGNVRRTDRKQKVDAMAAAILLQGYLDARE
jgi:putative Holliday junction resolvase